MNFEFPPNLKPFSPSTLLATWFGCGFLKPAPGTWGSFGALPFAIILFKFLGMDGFILSIIAITVIGLWAAYEFEKSTGIHDSKMVVIDEVAGQWIALVPVFALTSAGFLWVAAAFALFRFFDILKPGPIAYCDENFKGAFGVMFDDILAGIAAALILTGVIYVGFS